MSTPRSTAPAGRGRRALRLAALTGLASALSYCGGSTRGTPIELEVEVTATAASGDPARFETATGWAVTLDEAAVRFGPVWFYGGGRRASLELPRPGLRAALAHPADGTFDRGPVLSEILAQHAVDLLAGPTPLGTYEGIEGQLETLEVQLRPDGYGPLGIDAAAAALDGATFRLAGVAQKDGARVPFVAEGDLPEAQQVIDSIDTDLSLDGRSGRLVIEIHLDEWLGLVEFSALSTTDPSGDFVFAADQQPTAALHRGLRSRFAYRARWSSP